MRRDVTCLGTKRSAAEWAARGLLAALAAALALASLADSLAAVAVIVDPAEAHRLAPWSGRITAALAAERFALEPTPSTSSDAARLALLALRQDPTAIDALSVLMLQSQLRNETYRSRAIFRVSEALSRRELKPQLWAIQDAVNRGDISDALDHYDLALRTSDVASDLLFPVLARAVAEPKIRSMLIDKLATRPNWARSFINYLAVNVVDPTTTVRFFEQADRAALPILDVERTAVVNAVAARGLYDQAWSYYTLFRRGVRRDSSRDAHFLISTDDPALFDWATLNDAGATASIQRSLGGGGLVDFSAPSGAGGAVLKQTELFPPGTYVLEGRSANINLPADSRPYWRLSCQDGREVGRVGVPNSTEADGKFIGVLTVPSQCRVQTLIFVVRSSSELAGVVGQILSVSLHPSERSPI
jgi:hypothetical protein